jgi:hypothetical protein
MYEGEEIQLTIRLTKSLKLRIDSAMAYATTHSVNTMPILPKNQRTKRCGYVNGLNLGIDEYRCFTGNMTCSYTGNQNLLSVK